jgi:hypothetical protein
LERTNLNLPAITVAGNEIPLSRCEEAALLPSLPFLNHYLKLFLETKCCLWRLCVPYTILVLVRNASIAVQLKHKMLIVQNFQNGRRLEELNILLRETVMVCLLSSSSGNKVKELVTFLVFFLAENFRFHISCLLSLSDFSCTRVCR